MDKTIDYFMDLPYTIQVIRDTNPEDPGWVAHVVELPGCLTQADSFEELEDMIKDAIRSWVETALEDGIPVPEPRPVEGYSGKFVVRLPKSLHREVVESATQDGVSLNSFVNIALAKAVCGVGGSKVSQID